ncbi:MULTISPECIES: hypothetical protein [unclassified Amycolatopsis]|uniref:hypothetical protein n=1 Tax=unclassified Amycolatopsis TaxID=2618356 RepID=UPI000488C993|nr:hypothetical protein [Amycolatopsis sp. ATCC 39116]
MIRAFAPVLGSNGGGAILNVLSNLSWLSYDGNNAYAVAESAEWSLTNGVRLEPAGQGTLVRGVVFGPTATETMRTYASDAVMHDPVDIVRTRSTGSRPARPRSSPIGSARRRRPRRPGRPGDSSWRRFPADSRRAGRRVPVGLPGHHHASPPSR